MSNYCYRITADLIVVIHFLWILFMLWGAGRTIWAVIKREKRFLGSMWLRSLHLGGILFVAFFIIIRKPCPLTIWEIRLREISGVESYTGSFIIHYIEQIVYPSVPAWIVNIPSILIGCIILFFYIIYPPFIVKKK